MPGRRTPAAALSGLRAVHTAIWFSVEGCVVYLLVAGARGKTGRRSAQAATVVGLETAVFLANGAHCPLTSLAERLGAERAGVTDIFLPGWLARNLPALHVPVLLAAAGLHYRAWQRRT